MGSFVIYVIVVTFILVIYYVVMICLDLFGTRGEKKDGVEVIHAGAPIADPASSSVTSPVKVNEEEGGKFSMNNPNVKQEAAAAEEEPATSSPAEETESSVPAGQESLSAADIIGADDEELFAQSKAKIDGIKENLNNIPPTIQGAVYVDDLQDTCMKAIERAKYLEEQAEQLSV